MCPYVNWLVDYKFIVERSVCMRVFKNGWGAKMFCFSRANHTAWISKSSQVQNLTSLLYLPIPSLAETWKIVTRKVCRFFFSPKLTVKARKVRILESIFLQNKNWLRVQDFVDKILRLVRISLLISAIQRVLRFFSGNLFYKSNRKLFSCVCIAWYQHSRR